MGSEASEFLVGLSLTKRPKVAHVTNSKYCDPNLPLSVLPYAGQFLPCGIAGRPRTVPSTHQILAQVDTQAANL